MTYLSLWIANFGVVPWFSFLFFLFLPLFLSLSRLLHLVCIVLEAISKSLFHSIITLKIRNIVLTSSVSIVKIIILSSYTNFEAHAQQHRQEKDIFLSKGEQMEISVQNLENYSVGNKEVLKHRYFSRKKKIIIKGAGVGFSDLIINQKGAPQRHLKIYVTSKRSQLKRMELAAALEKINLEVSSFGEILKVSGELDNLEDYLVFQKIKNQDKVKTISKVSLSNRFATEFITRIYLDFFQAGYDSINCQTILENFHCNYEGATGLPETLRVYQDQYFVKLINSKQATPLKIQLHIIMLSHSQNSLNGIGLSELSAPLETLINESKLQPNSGDLLFRNSELDAYLVASPSLSFVPAEPFSLRLGNDVPIINQTPNSTTTEFKFAGLSLEGKAIEVGENFKVTYQLAVTQNNQGNFSGPRGGSSCFLTRNKVKEILFIDLNEKSIRSTGIPWLNQIPFTRNLVTESQDQKRNLSLKVFMSIKEVL